MKILRRQRVALTYLMLVLNAMWQISQPLNAATLYWDIDGTTTGAGGAAPTGAWDGLNNFFNTDSTGGPGGTLSAVTSTLDTVTFAAGTDAIGSYTVTISGTQNIGGLTFEEGTVLLTGGTLNFGAVNAPLIVGPGLTSTIASTLAGSAGFTKSGAGLLILSGDNTAGLLGSIAVNQGVLRVQNAGALGSTAGSTSVASGAVLDLFGQTIGAEAVTINGTGISSGGALINSDTVNTARLSGVVTLNTASSVGGAGNLYLSGALAGNVNLNKVGAGTLTLSTAATRAGSASITTTIDGGTIRLENLTGMSSGTTHVTIVNTGGVLEIGSGVIHNQPVTLNNGGTIRGDGSASETGVITVPNTGTPSVTFSTSSAASILTLGNGDNDLTGGIAAATLNVSGPGTVLVGGDTTPTHNVLGTWTVGSGSTLRVQRGTDALLGNTANDITLNGGTFSLLATSDLNLNTGRVITMGTGGGTIEVGSGRIITVDDAGQITGTNALTKNGAGTLAVTAAQATLTGTTTVNGGTLSLSGAGTATAVTGWTISNRAVLTLDNTATNSTDRIANGLTSNGGTFNFTHAGAAVTNYAESVGALTLNAGALTMNGSQAAASQTSAVTLASIARSAGGTLLYSGAGAGVDTRNQLLITDVTGLPASGVAIPWAVVTDGTAANTAFAVHSGAGTSLSRLATYNTGAPSTWVAGNNARPTVTGGTSNAAKSVNTITFDNGVDLSGTAATALSADRAITITGGILQTGGTSLVTNNGTSSYSFAFGTNEALFHTIGTLDIATGSTADTNLTGSAGLTKSGAGTLVIRGNSTLTGTYRVNEGILEGRLAASFGATQPMHLNGGTLRLSNDAGAVFTPTVTVNADSSIEISRVTAAATATTQTIGTLTIGGGRTLTVNPNATQISGGATAYGLTTGVLTLTSGGAIISVANNGTGTGTMTVGAPSGNFLLTKIGAGDLVTNSTTTGFSGPVDVQAGRVGWSGASGTINEGQIFSGAGGIIKSGAGIVNLTGANIFTGGIQINAGTLQFSTVNNNAVTSPSNLGQGTDGISLGGGTLGFVGSTSQSTNRAVVLTANSTLSADGTAGATITYSGAFTATTATDVTLTLTGAGNGFITSTSLVPTRGAGDLTKAGTGTWTVSAGGKVSEDDILVNAGTLILSGLSKNLDDDIVVSGASTILNLNTTNVITGNSSTSAGLYARTGATINFNADNAYSAATGLDFILLSDTAVGNSTLNMNTFTTTTPRIDVGQSSTGYAGLVVGSGVLSVSTNINLYQGSVSAPLSGLGAVLKNFGGTLTLSGDNSGLTGTTASEVRGGTLILDYTTSNTTKLNALAGLRMTGGTLVLNGNASSDTLQSVSGLILSAPGGSSVITLNAGGAQKVALNVGSITHSLGGGTVRFNLPAGSQNSTNGVLTTQANVNGMIGGFATAYDGTSTGFAANSGGNVVVVAATVQDNVSLWATNQNVSDSTGYSGSFNYQKAINSVRFNAAGPSTVTLSAGGVLDVVSGGILQTNAVTGGSSTITGGLLKSTATNELIFTVDSATQPLIVASTVGGSTTVTKSGAGILLLTGTNGYTGGTILNGGILQVSGGNAIGDNSPLIFTGNQSSTLELLGNETVGSLVTVGSNSTAGAGIISEIRLNANVLTLNQTADATYSAIITSSTTAGTLVKSGGSTLTIASSSPGFTGKLQVDEGLVVLSGNFSNLSAATNLVLNGAGSLSIAGDQDATPVKVNDNANVQLNNTAFGSGILFTLSGGTSARTETMSALALGAGHNVITATSTNGAAGSLLFASVTPTNRATALVRGLGLGDTLVTQRGQIRFTAALTGGVGTTAGGAVGTTKNLVIFPYLVGDSTTAGLGNSFVTNTGATNGVRPLAAAEYTTDAAAFDALPAATLSDNNVRFTTGATLVGTATGINSLVLDGASPITLTGPASALEITSGAILSAQATSNTINTFTALTTGSSRDYTVYVTDPGGSLTIASAMTTSAPLVKSGAGTLILTNPAATNAFNSVYFNQGKVQVSTLDKLGTGAFTLNFYGGGLKFDGVFDPSSQTITLGTGGGTFDTNGNNIMLANAIGNSGAGGLTKAGLGTLTLQASATNTGATAVQEGRLIVNGGASNRLSTAGLTMGANTASGVLQLGDATNGVSNQTVSSLSTSGSGTANAIVGGGSGVSVLTVNQSTVTTYAGALGGVGTNENNLGITKTGVGSLTLSGSALSYVGATTVTGGTLTATTAVSGTTSLSVSGTGSILALNGGITNPANITSVTVGDGGTLNLLDTTGNKLSNLSALTLGGTGNGQIFLNLNAGDLVTAGDGLNTDTLSLAPGGVLNLFANNKITFNITDTGLSASQSYVLLDATTIGGGFTSGPLSLADYLLGMTPSGFTSLTLSNSTNNQIILTTGALITGNLYWRGLTDSTWNASADNWSTDKAGLIPSASTPGQGTDVVFQWDAPTNAAVTTALGQNFKINSLTFEASTTPANTPTSVTINSAGSSLELAPQVSTDGIKITIGGPAAASITTPVKLGANQTWNVADAGSSLTVSGVVSGAGTLAKTGPGTLNLSGANTFNNGISIKAGTVVGTVSNNVFGAGTITLGDTTGSNAATLQVNTTALSIANPIVLATNPAVGTLTIGTPVNAVAISPTFTGGITGSNNFTINNQSVSGTTTFSTNPINNAGAFTNASISTGTVTVSGGVGPNVSQIILSSTTSALTISKVGASTLAVKSSGTTLQNIQSSKILTVSSGITGTGDLILKNDGTLTSGITISTNNVSHAGSITNSGTGLNTIAGVTISAIIDTGMTGGLIQDSATSALQLTGANTFTSGITIKKGILEIATAVDSGGGVGNIITLGNSTANSDDASLRFQSTLTYNANQINVVAGSSGKLSIQGSRTTGDSVVQGAIFLANNLTIESGDAVAASSPSLIFTGGVTGNGNLIIDFDGAVHSTTAAFVQFTTNPVNMVGTITNQANLTASPTTISAEIGSNVTGVVQNSLTSALTLSGSNTFASNLTLTAGTLNLNSANAWGTAGGSFIISSGTINNSSAGAIVMATNKPVSIAGDFAFTGTQDLDLATGAVTLNGPAGNRTVTANAKTLAFNGIISDGTATGLIKAGAGVLALGGANAFTGGVTLNAGTLAINNATALGATAGTFVINAGTLDNTSAGAVTVTNNNPITVNGSFGFTGTQNLNLGTGAVTLTATPVITTTAGILTIGGVIDDGAGTFGITKSGAGTLVLTTASTYGGATSVDQGTLITGVDNALPAATALTVGAGTTAGTLDLATFNQTVTSLSSTGNTASVSSILIGTGKTLTVNGNVSLNNNTDNAQTFLTISGGGALAVNGASFTVGNNTTGTDSSSRATLDLAALSSVNVTVSGTLAVMLTGDNNSTHNSSLILSNTANSLTAATITVGGSATGGTQSLVLGNGTNQLRANTINIGTGGRDFGTVTFASGSGSVVVRNTAGSGRAAFNMGTGTQTTGVLGGAINTFDLSGHNADLLLSTLTIGGGNRNANRTDNFSFDQGILDATTVLVGDNNGTANASAANSQFVANLNIGGGTTTIGTGGLDIARGDTAVTGTDTIEGNVNISGTASVTVANNTTFGAAIRLANNTIATGLTTNASLNITGGSLTVSGHILKGASTGAGSATVTLAGGTLNASGNNIGSGSATVIFNAESGALQNLGELNGGGLLTKTTGGTLTLSGTNSYTGGTTVSGGTLLVNNISGSGTGSGVVTVNAGILGGTGIIAPGSGNAITVNGVLQVGGAAPVSGQTLTIATNAAATTINNLLTFDLFSGEASGTLNALTTADRLLFTGNSNGASVTLGASSVLGITTSIVGGWTSGSSWQLIDWAGLTPSGTFSNLNSTIGNFANLPDLSTQNLAWDVSAIYTTGVVSIVVIIPEPGRALLLLLGLLALFMRRRRD